MDSLVLQFLFLLNEELEFVVDAFDAALVVLAATPQLQGTGMDTRQRILCTLYPAALALAHLSGLDSDLELLGLPELLVGRLVDVEDTDPDGAVVRLVQLLIPDLVFGLLLVLKFNVHVSLSV